MRFVPDLKVGQRLILTMILVVVLSWGLGSFLAYQAMRMHLLGPARAPERLDRPPPPGQGAAPGSPRLTPEPSRPGGPPRGPGGPGHRPSWWNPFLFMNVGVGTLLALIAGRWLSRRFTRPLATLAEGATALGSGDLGHRIPVRGDDEFGRVAVSMNQMAERIAEQIGQLEQDRQRRQHLLADVAHELRSPIATLKTMAEALRDGVADTPERSDRAVRAIAESAERMEHLINDLLELARLDLEQLPLHPQPVDLRAASADALRRHRDAAVAARMTLHPVASGEPVLASADPHRLAEILDNLLDNALSHAGPGAEVTVTVTPGDPASLTVADTGRGISQEHLPYLFDAFYRVDSVRTPGDRHLGLGLRIARSLARAQGGDLSLESAEGQGTRALLTLPS